MKRRAESKLGVTSTKKHRKNEPVVSEQSELESELEKRRNSVESEDKESSSQEEVGSDDEESSSEEEQLPEDYTSGEDDDESDSDKDSFIENGDDQDGESMDVDDNEESDSKDKLSYDSFFGKKSEKQNSAAAVKTDEYAEDSSDEEDVRNTIGNIPLEWYKDHDHIGYDIHGKKVMKPQQADEIEQFLDKMDNADYWRTVTNKMTGEKVVLDPEDVKIIKNMQKGLNPNPSEEQYPEWIDFFSGEEMIHPVTNRPMDKRSFIPSKWERLKVGQMVHAIKMGWMKPRQEKKKDTEEDAYQFKTYDIWRDTPSDKILARYRQHIPAAKMPLPGHSESYNPPEEYLFTKEEEEKWKAQEPEDRRIDYIPKKYSSLRLVPAYPRYINERFERCLDLYLAPRQRKMKMDVNPQDLIPKLPRPKDLQPFPTVQSKIYKGHTAMIRSICPNPSGELLMSGSDDGTVKFWHVQTGRCIKTVEVGEPVINVAWNPNPDVSLVAVVVCTSVLLINPGLGDKLVVSKTDTMLLTNEEEPTTSDETEQPVDWVKSDLDVKDYEKGIRLRVEHPKLISQVTWHPKGDYFATVMPEGEKLAVLIHLLSKRRSQNPFTKSKGRVECVKFHPIKPILFVATQRFVRIYNLAEKELTKKLQTNCKWVSSMDIHYGGDNVIIGSYDSRTSWFDLDLSTKPYQTLKHQKRAVRQVAYHRRYPLFASASDDGTIIVCHGKVFSDLLQNPLIVPVKILRGHAITDRRGVLDCKFHPTQPWIFSSGADGTIRLFT